MTLLMSQAPSAPPRRAPGENAPKRSPEEEDAWNAVAHPGGIVEVQIARGVEVSGAQMRAIQRRADELSPYAGAALLVDYTREHTLGFEAQQILMQDQHWLGAVAFFVPPERRSIRGVVQYIADAYLTHTPAQVFANRTRAQRWLESAIAPGSSE